MSAIFSPAGPTQTVSATTTSAAAEYWNWMGAPQLRVYNAGANTVFIEWGVAARLPSNTTTATVAASLPVPPGVIEVFTKGEANVVAVITATGTATVYLTPGSGG